MSMSPAWEAGFESRCVDFGLSPAEARALSKAAADPDLARAEAVFRDWLTVPKHTVRRGEVLSGVARRYGVGLDALMEENGLANSVAIRPGQVLRIPVAKGSGNGKSRKA